jgi:hypothetical protein
VTEHRDKRAKFVDLAEARTSKAMHTIRLIGNLASRSNYEYSEADVQKIVRALELEVRDLRSRFQSSDSRSRPEFKL